MQRWCQAVLRRAHKLRHLAGPDRPLAVFLVFEQLRGYSLLGIESSST